MRDDPRTHKLMEGFYILSKDGTIPFPCRKRIALSQNYQKCLLHHSALFIICISFTIRYIWTHYTAYDANISRNSYVYNGCSWLIYHEFVCPEGHTIVTYRWTDHPSLGIAPYTCKIASQMYKY